MIFRVGFWTSAVPYLLVVLLYDFFTTAGQIFFEASMGALLGLIFASVFAGRANRSEFGPLY